MALKIRLRKQGSVNNPAFRVVVCDSRAPRDGKYLEAVGWYHPRMKDESKKYELKVDRIQFWLSQGAEISDKVEFLVKKASPGMIQAMHAKKAQKKTKPKAAPKKSTAKKK